MKKKKYVVPQTDVFVMNSETLLSVSGSGRFDLKLTDTENLEDNISGPAKEENPDDIDAKKGFLWDDEW